MYLTHSAGAGAMPLNKTVSCQCLFYETLLFLPTIRVHALEMLDDEESKSNRSISRTFMKGRGSLFVQKGATIPFSAFALLPEFAGKSRNTKILDGFI